jgi:hypothetical protein
MEVEMGKYFKTQLNGETITVKVIEVEQNPNHSGHGKWVCLNEQTGRKLHRTRRQLYALESVVDGKTRVRIRDGVPLRGAHGNERTGIAHRTLDFYYSSSPSITVKLDPDGKIGGPFHINEYEVIT